MHYSAGKLKKDNCYFTLKTFKFKILINIHKKTTYKIQTNESVCLTFEVESLQM